MTRMGGARTSERKENREGEREKRMSEKTRERGSGGVRSVGYGKREKEYAKEGEREACSHGWLSLCWRLQSLTDEQRTAFTDIIK